MKVNLKIKEDNKTETFQHEIEEMNLIQVTRAIKTIRDVIKLAQDDENLKELLKEVFDETEEGQENVEEAEGQEDAEEEFGKDIAQKLFGALDILLVEVPEKAFELLAIMANIEHKVFMQQKPEDVFDIYDAVIQVNDIEKLINRAKKSLELTKSQVKVMSIFQKKKQPELKQA